MQWKRLISFAQFHSAENFEHTQFSQTPSFFCESFYCDVGLYFTSFFELPRRIEKRSHSKFWIVP